MAKYQDVIIAGFGGQGALAIGKNLAEAGMAEGLRQMTKLFGRQETDL